MSGSGRPHAGAGKGLSLPFSATAAWGLGAAFPSGNSTMGWGNIPLGTDGANPFASPLGAGSSVSQQPGNVNPGAAPSGGGGSSNQQRPGVSSGSPAEAGGTVTVGVTTPAAQPSNKAHAGAPAASSNVQGTGGPVPNAGRPAGIVAGGVGPSADVSHVVGAGQNAVGAGTVIGLPGAGGFNMPSGMTGTAAPGGSTAQAGSLAGLEAYFLANASARIPPGSATTQPLPSDPFDQAGASRSTAAAAAAAAMAAAASWGQIGPTAVPQAGEQSVPVGGGGPFNASANRTQPGNQQVQQQAKPQQYDPAQMMLNSQQHAQQLQQAQHSQPRLTQELLQQHTAQQGMIYVKPAQQVQPQQQPQQVQPPQQQYQQLLLQQNANYGSQWQQQQQQQPAPLMKAPPGAADLPALPEASSNSAFEVAWEYLDTQGNVQGPFTVRNMYDWWCVGHFDSGVYVRCVGGYWTQIGLVMRDMNRFMGGPPFPPPTPAASAITGVPSTAPAPAAAPSLQGWATSNNNTPQPTEAIKAQLPPPHLVQNDNAAAPVRQQGPTEQGEAGDQGRLQEAVSLFFCDHSADLRWFYLDDQGMIQGPFLPARMVSWCNLGHLRLDVRVVGVVLPGAAQQEKGVRVPEQLSSVGRGGDPWFIPLGMLLDAVSSHRKYQPLRTEDLCRGRPPPSWSAFSTQGPAGGVGGRAGQAVASRQDSRIEHGYDKDRGNARQHEGFRQPTQHQQVPGAGRDGRAGARGDDHTGRPGVGGGGLGSREVGRNMSSGGPMARDGGAGREVIRGGAASASQGRTAQEIVDEARAARQRRNLETGPHGGNIAGGSRDVGPGARSGAPMSGGAGGGSGRGNTAGGEDSASQRGRRGDRGQETGGGRGPQQPQAQQVQNRQGSSEASRKDSGIAGASKEQQQQRGGAGARTNSTTRRDRGGTVAAAAGTTSGGTSGAPAPASEGGGTTGSSRGGNAGSGRRGDSASNAREQRSEPAAAAGAATAGGPAGAAAGGAGKAGVSEVAKAAVARMITGGGNAPALRGPSAASVKANAASAGSASGPAAPKPGVQAQQVKGVAVSLKTDDSGDVKLSISLRASAVGGTDNGACVAGKAGAKAPAEEVIAPAAAPAGPGSSSGKTSASEGSKSEPAHAVVPESAPAFSPAPAPQPAQPQQLPLAKPEKNIALSLCANDSGGIRLSIRTNGDADCSNGGGDNGGGSGAAGTGGASSGRHVPMAHPLSITDADA